MASQTHRQDLGLGEDSNSRPFGDTSLGISIGRSIAGLSLACGVWIVFRALEGVLKVIWLIGK